MTTTTPTAPWYDDHANLATLLRYLEQSEDGAPDVDNIIDLLEKPWRWESEWAKARASSAGEAAAIRDARELRELREAGAHWGDTET